MFLQQEQRENKSIVSEGSKVVEFDDSLFDTLDVLSELGLSRFRSLSDISLLTDRLEDRLLQENMVGEHVKDATESDYIMLDASVSSNKKTGEAEDDLSLPSIEPVSIVDLTKDREIREKLSSESDDKVSKAESSDHSSNRSNKSSILRNNHIASYISS